MQIILVSPNSEPWKFDLDEWMAGMGADGIAESTLADVRRAITDQKQWYGTLGNDPQPVAILTADYLRSVVDGEVSPVMT